jgi:hypothetical protein
MYGQLGVLAYDNIDDKVQCHVCGKWFIYLAPHLRWKHNLTVDEYREDFGLNRRQPLCAEGLSEKHRRHFVEAGLVGKHLVFNLSELFSHKGQKERLQAKLNMSRTRTGRPIKLTPQGKEARRQNVRNNLFAPLPCVECGTIVVANKFGKGSVVCPECRREHKRKYMKQWADANRQHLREYWRDYDRKRSPRVDKGKASSQLSRCNPG